MPHISIKAESVFEIAGMPVTNSLLASFLVTGLFFLMARYYKSQVEKRNKGAFFYVLHTLIKTIYDLFTSVLHDKITVFFPLLGAFFFFILLNNWFGLVPGVGSLLIAVHEHEIERHIPIFRGATADLNGTVALALVSVISTQVYGLRFLGVKAHIGKYINFSDPVSFFVGILELIQEFARVISFSFRLFGNIFAGEVLLTIVTFLLPIFVGFISFPMFGMELFVGFVQALVFTMLTAVFINMAIHKHE